MGIDLTRRQLIASGGLGAAGIGAGAVAVFGTAGQGPGGGGSPSPLDWLRADGVGSTWQTFYSWDQPRYEQVEPDLPRADRDRDGSRYLSNESFREAITIERGVFTDTRPWGGFATTGSVDVDALVSQEFPAPAIRERLASQGFDGEWTVEELGSHRNLKLYRQRFSDSGYVRAIALNESTIVCSHPIEGATVAVESVKGRTDAWIDGDQRRTATSDSFAQLAAALDLGFVGKIAVDRRGDLMGWTVEIDGDTGISRTVRPLPTAVSEGCADAAEEALRDYVGMFSSLPDSVSDLSVEITDGIGVIEVRVPLDDLEMAFNQFGLVRMGAFANCDTTTDQ